MEKANITCWTVSDARVNIAALLNDPRKTRRDHDFFSKTWGDYFKELAPTSSHSFLERAKVQTVSKLDFVGYFARHYDKLFRRHIQHLALMQTESSTESVSPSRLMFASFDTRTTKPENNEIKLEMQKRAEANAFEVLQSVPELFLRSDFSLENPSILMSVLNFNKMSLEKFQEDLEEKLLSTKLLQEKLSHCLDSVEVAIVRQISFRSDGFFGAMTSHDELNECIKKMSLSIIHLREKNCFAGNHLGSKSLKIVQLLSNRRRQLLLMERLLTMITVHQAQPTIQLLLSTNEYSGALDLIETTQQVLKQEMNGLSCFRHLSSQLSVMENVISCMMKEELSHCITIDLQRPLEEGSSAVNPHHLRAIALGLIRRNQLLFLDEFREEAKRMIKSFMKKDVMKAISTADENVSPDSSSATAFDDGPVNDDGKVNIAVKETTLAGKMRLLNFNGWIDMLDEIFADLCVFLRRVISFLTVIVNVICTSFLQTRGYAPELSCQRVPAPRKFSLSCTEFLQPQCFMRKGYDETDDDYSVLGDMAHYEEKLMESVVSNTNCSSVTNKSMPARNFQPVQSSGKLHTFYDTEANCDFVLSDTEHNNMMQSLSETLSWTAEFAHDRCVKVINAKNKDSSLDKLTSTESLLLAQAIEKHLTEVDDLLNLKNWCSEDARYLIGNFNACYGMRMKRGNVLRGVLQSRASQYINRFHGQRKTNLNLILNNETWRQAEVPAELSKILQNLSGSHDQSEMEGFEALSEDSMSATLYLDGIHFTVCGSVLLLLKMVIEYIRCTDDLPASTPDLVVRATELLTIFNSRSCQLVLGAGALQVVGLKTISTKNLGLVSQCLQLVLHLLPSIKHRMEEKLAKHGPRILTSSHNTCLKHFEHVAKAYKDHTSEINCKLVTIMNSAIENNLSKWQVRAPMPSKEFRTICRQILKFHEAIDDLLPKEQIILIFEKLHSRFKQRLQGKIQSFAIYNDGGPQYGLVMSDLVFYEENMKSLKVIPEDRISLQSIWN